MSKKNIESISVILTEHAERRISKRFGVEDSEEIEKVLSHAIISGRITDDGNGGHLVEYGCLIVAGTRENGRFTVSTVLNLSEGLSEEIKNRLREVKPTPWQDCEVEMPGDGVGELYLSPSSGSSVFSKTETLGAFLPQQKTREWGLNNE